LRGEGPPPSEIATGPEGASAFRRQQARRRTPRLIRLIVLLWTP
jgi:hypothetical protein